MKVLITGGSGLLGKALIEKNSLLAQIGAVYLGSYNMADKERVVYFNADICKTDEQEYIFFKVRPKITIHTAGVANVDYCERNFEEARNSNVTGTLNMIGLCKKYDSKIVYISTNAVFDGKNAPYCEDDIPNPINNYGKLKLECENIVRESGLRFIIVRPILMYGWNNAMERFNPVTWLLQKLRNNERVYMVDDIYENPVLNHNCADIIWSLIKLDKTGIYHIAGRDVVNRYEFAKQIAKVFGLEWKNLIIPVKSSFFPEIALRPMNTSYNTRKIERELNIEPIGLRNGLLYMKKIGCEYQDDYLSKLKCQK